MVTPYLNHNLIWSVGFNSLAFTMSLPFDPLLKGSSDK